MNGTKIVSWHRVIYPQTHAVPPENIKERFRRIVQAIESPEDVRLVMAAIEAKEFSVTGEDARAFVAEITFRLNHYEFASKHFPHLVSARSIPRNAGEGEV